MEIRTTWLVITKKNACMHIQQTEKKTADITPRDRHLLHTRSPFKNETCTNLLDLNSRT
jgi:hypothetical protein